ncbi:MAG: ion transporter [Halobacteriota archaeon]
MQVKGAREYNRIMSAGLKARIYDILDFDQRGDYLELGVSVFLIALIFLNVLIVIAETKDDIGIRFGQLFFGIEVFSLGIFTVEYGLRAWCCTCNEKYCHPVKGRLRYLVTPFALVDLVAILPTLATWLISLFLPIAMVSLVFLRGLRLFRTFRLFKLGRYNDALSTIKAVLRNKSGELFVAFFIGCIVLVMVSCLMYYAEHEVQPAAFASIPDTMWWALLTLSTVGYGDIYPITLPGRILEIFIAVMGITLFALPAGILGSGFYDEVQKRRKEKSAAEETQPLLPQDIVAEIHKAGALKDANKLSDSEFEEIKRRLLQ